MLKEHNMGEFRGQWAGGAAATPFPLKVCFIVIEFGLRKIKSI